MANMKLQSPECFQEKCGGEDGSGYAEPHLQKYPEVREGAGMETHRVEVVTSNELRNVLQGIKTRMDSRRVRWSSRRLTRASNTRSSV